MPRIERVDKEIKKELSSLIAYKIRDPRVNSMVSVTNVQTTKDLKYAKIFISVFNSENPKEIIKILNNASSFLRKELFHNLKIRTVPELNFVLDDNIENGFKIEKILEEIKKENEEKNV